MNNIFDSLFESDLERLERKFIIEPNKLLWKLECNMLNYLDKYNMAKTQFLDYKKKIRGKIKW